MPGPPRVPVVAVAHDPAHRRRRPPTDGTVSGAGPARRPGLAQRQRARLRRWRRRWPPERRRPARRWPNPGLRDPAQHPPSSPGRPSCQGEIDADPNRAHVVIAIRKPVQRLGASRVAHRLPLNTCRTRHLDGTPTGAEPSSTRCPASPRAVPKPWVASAAAGPARSESEPPVLRAGRPEQIAR